MTTTEEEKPLRLFLKTFGVKALGDGDPVVGANTLASMACALANLAPADRKLISRDGNSARLGTSLMTSGAASTGRMVDEIITEVSLRQNILARHLNVYSKWLEALIQKHGAAHAPRGSRTTTAEKILCQLMGHSDSFYDCREESWAEVITSAPNEGITRPKFFVSASRSEELKKQLKDLCAGRPLVYLGLHRPADLIEFAEIGGALLEGRYPAEDRNETVQGNIFIADAMRMIGEAAKNPDERMMWLSHFVWLCDGDAGPELPENAAEEEGDEKRGNEIRERFGLALSRVLAMRIDGLTYHLPTVSELGEVRVRWAAFLKTMERRLPGISGAGRNLLSSLIFGLCEICSAKTGMSFKIEGAEAFARYLVRRMANAREVMLCESEIARRQSQIERVFQKLESGPQDSRTIYRALSLSGADCDGCLRWLEAEKLISRTGKEWSRVDGARLNFTTHELSVLEA